MGPKPTPCLSTAPRWALDTGGWLVSLLLSSTTSAQSTVSVNVNAQGEAGNFGCTTHGAPTFSLDNRFVAFTSSASNLVAGDTNAFHDVFVYDRLTGSVVRASVPSTGLSTVGGGGFYSSIISDDGSCVAFESTAFDLVLGDTNGCMDAFVHELATGVTSRVSVGAGGAQSNGDSGISGMDLSADGRYVAFVSAANNLVPSDTNLRIDVFVHDRAVGATTRVSVGPAGVQANGDSYGPQLSADGRYVAFHSFAYNLVPSDTNQASDAFVYDRATGTTERVSVATAGSQGNGASHSTSVSSDARFAGFVSAASSLVSGDTNQWWDVFVRDRQLGLTTRVSVSSSGAQANADCDDAAISADGRFVAFRSTASNLVAGDTNGVLDVFVHDRQTGVTERASVASSGAQADAQCVYPAISPDGRLVAFYSPANTLIPGKTSGWTDAIVRDRVGCAPTIASYCSAGTTTHGCVPALAGVGAPSGSSSGGFTLTANAVEGQRNGLLFYGLSGPLAAPWSGGTSSLCVKPPVQRTIVVNSGGTSGACDGVLALDWNHYVATHSGALGAPFAGGESVWAQAWFRDPQAPGGSNLSNAVWFQVCP